MILKSKSWIDARRAASGDVERQLSNIFEDNNKFYNDYNRITRKVYLKAILNMIIDICENKIHNKLIYIQDILFFINKLLENKQIAPNPQITKKNEFTKNLDNLLKILIKILFDLSYGTDISNSIKRLKTFRDCIKSIKQDTPNEVIC